MAFKAPHDAEISTHHQLYCEGGRRQPGPGTTSRGPRGRPRPGPPQLGPAPGGRGGSVPPAVAALGAAALVEGGHGLVGRARLDLHEVGAGVLALGARLCGAGGAGP